MISSVVNFVRLPLVLLTIWTIARFSLGMFGMPYAPRGNAMFSVVGLTVISCLYYGALSAKIGKFSWLGTALIGVAIGLFAQILIFGATLLSYAGGFSSSYFIHWDALNQPEGTVATMGTAIGTRVFGLFVNSILSAIIAMVGRLLSPLAPPMSAKA
jgi:hypothetical protein